MSWLGRMSRLAHHRLAQLRPSLHTVIRPANAVPGQYRIGLAITAYNRPQYLRRMLDHLRASVLNDTIVAIVDDASTSPETRQLVRDLSLASTPVVKIFRERRRGFAVHEALRDAWDLLVDEYHCPLVTNLDSDVIMKPEWLERVTTLFLRERARLGPLIVTGFHSRDTPIISEEGDYCIKLAVGGPHMFFDASLYRDVVRPNLRYEPTTEVGWDHFVVDQMYALGYPLLAVRPSVVQHIGAVGRFSSPEKYDVADDY